MENEFGSATAHDVCVRNIATLIRNTIKFDVTDMDFFAVLTASDATPAAKACWEISQSR
jgi:hypothetical protein